MEDRMRYALAIIVVMLLLAGCSDKGSTGPQAQYSISGRVTNQSGDPATGLDIFVQERPGFESTVHTDNNGMYSVTVERADSVYVVLEPTSFILPALSRFYPKDTLIYVDSPIVLNMRVREFTYIFHDTGGVPTAWQGHGGVEQDSTGYMLSYVEGDSTYMVMGASYSVPDSSHGSIMFTFFAQTSPSDTAEIMINAEVNGVQLESQWRQLVHETPSWHGAYFDSTDVRAGNDLRLTMTFRKVHGESVHIAENFIFSY
jgi:hypothetical protein